MEEKPKHKAKRENTAPKYDEYALMQLVVSLFIICICVIVSPIINNALHSLLLNIKSESLTISLEPDTVLGSDSHHPACGIITIYDIQKQEAGAFALINTADDTLNPINFDYLELDSYRFTDVVDVSAARQNGNRDSYRFLYQLPFEGKQGLTVAIREGFSEYTDGAIGFIFENHGDDMDVAIRPELAECGG